VKKKERRKRCSEIDLMDLFEGNLSSRGKNEGFEKLIERFDYKREDEAIEIEVIYKIKAVPVIFIHKNAWLEINIQSKHF
jgi:hypothetical protein